MNTFTKSFMLLASLLMASISNANIITEVLSGSDNGFGYSGVHYATGCKSMCGGNFGHVTLGAGTSFFHEGDSGDNFQLYLKFTDGAYSGTGFKLNGNLDFTDADNDGLVGIFDVTFDDATLQTTYGANDFKFAAGVMGIGGVNVPNPNSVSGDLLSLWGANSSVGPLNSGIGFDPSTATLGMDLVVKWANVPTPTPLPLMSLGLFLMFMRKGAKKTA